jgi:hypothetical protein
LMDTVNITRLNQHVHLQDARSYTQCVSAQDDTRHQIACRHQRRRVVDAPIHGSALTALMDPASHGLARENAMRRS